MGSEAGRTDSATTRALQRADPPADALAWVLSVSQARTIERVEPMRGGASLAMHRVTVSSANGASNRLVLRRYVRPEQTTDDPGVAAHEAAVLQLVERIATPTPRLIGVDPTGGAAGVPAVLMTELPGRPEWTADQRWMRQLVDILADIHSIAAFAAAGVRPFAVYAQSSYAVPPWATKPAVWERALEIFHGPVLDDDRTFIHRDFYPGNVLWHRRTVSGLVDWEAASIGPRSIDVAHCRINLLYDGLDTADIFTRTWEQSTGRTFHRWADIATIIGLLDAERRNPPAERKRHGIETMLQQAVDQIDGS